MEEIPVGSVVSAQHTDGTWYDNVKVVMCSQGIRGEVYGVVFPNNTQVIQLQRKKIKTQKEIEVGEAHFQNKHSNNLIAPHL